MDNDEQRDPAEERYNRDFCPACGNSPCTWDGRPDGFHTDDGPDPSPPAPLQVPPQPEMTARKLAGQLNRAGFRDSAIELLAAPPGLRPHVARLAAGRCEDARVPGALASRLRQWADEEETWQAGAIADALIMTACARHPAGICTDAINLAAEAVLATRSIAGPMDGSLLTRPRLRPAG